MMPERSAEDFSAEVEELAEELQIPLYLAAIEVAALHNLSTTLIRMDRLLTIRLKLLIAHELGMTVKMK